jgi:hypothetical protein
MRELLDFLAEPWDPAMLTHDQQPHDLPVRYASFSSARRAATQEETAIHRSRVGAHSRKSDPLLRALFLIRSGGMLEELSCCSGRLRRGE